MAVVEVASEVERAGAGVVVTAVGVEVVEIAALLLIELVEDAMSTIPVVVELALVLTELASLPPSPH